MTPHRGSCLGVSGHRHLSHADPTQLHRRLTEVLTAAASSVASPWLASSLAEGADRLTAQVALDLGFDLFCPLPFAVAAYERDFRDATSRDEFRRLLARAREVTTAAVPPGAAREVGYTEAGRAVLRASRALLALWDGEPPRGEGGTGQMVAEAIKARIPVIWLRVEPPHPLMVRPAGRAWQQGTPASLAGCLSPAAG